MDIAALVVLVVLVLGAFLIFGLAFKLLWAFVVGLVIGSLAKLVLPGRQDLGWFTTALAGVIGSIVGSMIGHRLLHTGWLVTLVIEVVCAAGVVLLLAGKKKGEE